jgi:hypothetical protein
VVILIPFATPRFSVGTEPITELTFGGENKAIPNPNRSRLTNTAPYEELAFNVENQINPIALKVKPNELKTRLPYLSDNLPLTGLKRATTICIGISKSPVFNTL